MGNKKKNFEGESNFAENTKLFLLLVSNKLRRVLNANRTNSVKIKRNRFNRSKVDFSIKTFNRNSRIFIDK